MARRPDVTLAQLRYFVEAANWLSMTRAAEELLVAQSAVSAAITQLEDQIQAQLFVRRRSKGLVLTAAGEQLLRDSRSLLAHLDEALDAARGQENTVRGTVRIACFVTLTPFVLPELIAELADSCPQLEVDVAEVDADGARELLRRGSAELAISYDFAYGDDVRRETIGTAAPYVLLPPDHRLARRSWIDLADLAEVPMVLLDLPHSREYFLGLMRQAGVDPIVRYRSASYETVRTLVGRGHGFSILNQRPASNRTYDGSKVAELSIKGGGHELDVVVASLAAVRRTARSRVVADTLRRQFAAR